MKVAVVFESMFGNTHKVAEAIREGMLEARPDATVECVPVSEASAEQVGTVDLLVVGGPTHLWGADSGRSRRMKSASANEAGSSGQATQELELHAEPSDLGHWFAALPEVGGGRRAAAFDTRLPSPLAGGAARSVARRLRRHGYELVTEPEGFTVTEAYGALREGEIERAKRWGATLVS
jgi:hypothetical protein